MLNMIDLQIILFSTHDKPYQEELGSCITIQLIQAYHQYGFVNYKKGALDLQPQVIKVTSCWPMVGGSLRVLRLLPTLKLVVMM